MLEEIMFRHILRHDELHETVSSILATYDTYEDTATHLETAITDHVIETGISDFVAELLAAVIQHTDFFLLIDLFDQS